MTSRMTERFDTAPERCALCGLNLWADRENEQFVDAREISDPDATSWLCPGTDRTHEVA